ncbi:MAG: metallophosphoesterase [Muribaculum sp.]|nr:metallophosphoesterase [Muribaculum sp.]
MTRKFLISFILLIGFIANAQDKKDWEQLKADITFIVCNDNGRNGYYDQRPIAETMGKMAESIDPEAVLALGDAFHYIGVESVNDPLWNSNYETIYTNPELMVEWFPILGNHEYRGNTQAVLDYSGVSRRWCMPSKYYSKSFRDKHTSVKIVMLDTTPLIDKYRTNAEEYPDVVKEDMNVQLQWLDEELANAKEDWIIVAGHHPIFADTDKSKSERTDMQTRVDSILRKHNVDMYICGHIHNFQHIKPADSEIDYIVNSSASLSREKVMPIDGTVYASGKPGFSVLGVTDDKLTLSMIDKEGNILYQVIREKK